MFKMLFKIDIPTLSLLVYAILLNESMFCIWYYLLVNIYASIKKCAKTTGAILYESVLFVLQQQYWNYARATL